MDPASYWSVEHCRWEPCGDRYWSVQRCRWEPVGPPADALPTPWSVFVAGRAAAEVPQQRGSDPACVEA